MAERSIIDPPTPRRGGGSGAADEAAKVAAEKDHRIEIITPEKAKQWLGADVNSHNRRISKRKIRAIARDMTNGAWDYTGDPFRFDRDGKLLDGQHRLLACIEANYSFPGLIIRDLPSAIQERLDQGMMRRAHDHLYLRGYGNSLRLAATARVLFRLKHKGETKAWGAPTNAEVLALIDKHKRLEASAGAIDNSVVGIPPSIISAVHYIGFNLLREPDIADAFLSVFSTGNPYYEGEDRDRDPAHLWRERLLRERDRGSMLRIDRQLVGTIHAWNLFSKREAVSHFRMPEDADIDGLDPARI